LELEIHLNEKYIYLHEEINEIVEHLVDGLSYNYPDKEEIEIRLLNDIDLSRYHKYKYRRKVYDEKLTTYTCKNKYKNTGIKRMLEKQ